MEKYPEQSIAEKINKIVEETFKMIKDLEENKRIKILGTEEEIKKKPGLMFKKESEKKVEKDKSIWEASVAVREFLENALSEGLLEIQGESSEEKETNHTLLIERIKNNIYKFRSYWQF